MSLAEHSIAWHAERALGIGGSDAKRIMDGDWFALWQEKTGRVEPEDLSGVLQVQLGSFTEPFNLAWFQKNTGLEVSHAGCEGLVHAKHGFMRANLDGRVAGSIVEAKHVSAFAKDAEILERYWPQLQHCLVVSAERLAYLSVIFGNHRWDTFEVEAEPDYQAALIEREAAFWRHVETDEPPENPETVALAVSFDDMREVDLTGNNEWASGAADWLENREASKVFNKAAKALRAMVEADVKLARGHGVKATRAKNGALTIGSA